MASSKKITKSTVPKAKSSKAKSAAPKPTPVAEFKVPKVEPAAVVAVVAAEEPVAPKPTTSEKVQSHLDDLSEIRDSRGELKRKFDAFSKEQGLVHRDLDKKERVALARLATLTKHVAKGEKKRVKRVQKEDPLTDEACKLLGLEPGSKMARGQVTQELFKYRDRKFPDYKTNGKGREFPYDADLFSALQIGKDVELRMHNLQSYTKKLIIPA
jgi:hypothetical protein